jgi:hypothetical protein
MTEVVSIDLPVFGVPVRFEADDDELLALVEASFGAWRGGEVSHDGAGLRVRLHRTVEEESGEETPEVRVRILPDQRRMVLSTRASVAMADPDRGEAFGYLSAALVAQPAHARGAFVDALTLRMMGRNGRLPFHAAVVARDDAAVLLTGSSGAGKSSLAYACARAGMRVIGEEVAWIQRSPTPRVWGRSEALHLLPDAVRFFPELGDRPLVPRANGKEKIAVDLGALGAIGKPFATRVGLCVLSRGGGVPRLDPLDRRDAEAALRAEIAPGFDLFRDETIAVLPAMVAGGCWRLDPGPHPVGAVPFVEDMLRSIQAHHSA